MCHPNEAAELRPQHYNPAVFRINVRRRRQLTRGLTRQSCPVNLSHLHSQVHLLLNSPCDMLLAAWMAWLTAVLIPALGGASADVLGMREGDWGGRARVRWMGPKGWREWRVICCSVLIRCAKQHRGAATATMGARGGLGGWDGGLGVRRIYTRSHSLLLTVSFPWANLGAQLNTASKTQT